MFAHHPVFKRYVCWQGPLEPEFTVNFLGIRTRLEFSTFLEKPKQSPLAYPAFEEEYFEWIDLLQAVERAADDFTMIELGAGYGRWLVNATGALRQTKPTLAPHLIGVEAEPVHFTWMQTHFRDNGLNPNEHILLQAAVTAEDGEVRFYIGHSREWYGQSIAPYGGIFSRVRRSIRRSDVTRPWDDAKIVKVKAVSLSSLLRGLQFVDLIDLDVQGGEYAVLRAAAKQLDEKVRCVHIGTHGKRIEENLRELFRSMNWTNINDYSLQGKYETPYGLITFQDGVQTWLNSAKV